MADNDTFDRKALLQMLPLLLILVSGAFITILNQTLLGTALPVIMVDLDLSESTVQWLQSIFMLVNGIMIPVTAFLIQRFSTRKFFMTAIGLFAVAKGIAAIVSSFILLLIVRVFIVSDARMKMLVL